MAEEAEPQAEATVLTSDGAQVEAPSLPAEGTVVEAEPDPEPTPAEVLSATLQTVVEQHGAPTQTAFDLGYTSSTRLTGLAYAQLIDFDLDGTDELLVAYSTSDVGGPFDYVDYQVELWGVQDGEARLLLTETPHCGGGGNLMGVTVLDGRPYFLTGKGSADYDYRLYGLSDGQLVSRTVYRECEDPAYASAEIDGAPASLEDADAFLARIHEGATYAELDHRTGTGADALAITQETLATLGVA
ncbi:hypothetical protein QJ043_07135 [Olsenella sp. YH-ols2217]|uniref:VCBS repeat-containing protein n=1 Tax=Kribbibacterium absianum TaxID=3044210 RepID=A0ABT6ZLC6_9ACTN|nr:MULTISPECIES: hypothetical protein [unclassified Olsenella]MDJ1121840.1 hypothetical protein [Olsenella sp. YH-ols2216]MDJ1129848.1 hypothetical protein [Olsenella sp. YH-ols2217]